MAAWGTPDNPGNYVPGTSQVYGTVNNPGNYVPGSTQVSNFSQGGASQVPNPTATAPAPTASAQQYDPTFVQGLLAAKLAYDKTGQAPEDTNTIYSHLGGDNSIFHNMSSGDMANWMDQKGYTVYGPGGQSQVAATSILPQQQAPSTGNNSNGAGNAANGGAGTPGANQQSGGGAQPPVYKPVSYTPQPFQAGPQVSLQPTYSAINSLKPDQVFNLGQMQSAIQALQAMGGASQQAKYQTPQQLQGMISQMQQVLAPLTQQQQVDARSAYNQSMQQLDNKWAGRGLLASTGAAGAEQEAANQFAQGQADIQAKNQDKAITNAFQFADLGLKENNQLFNQQDSVVKNYLSGNQLQNTENQQYINNLLNTQRLDVSQNQWSQDYGQKQQAQDFGQWLQQQNMNNTLSNSQYDQWLKTQDLNNATNQQNFNQWLDTQKIDQSQQQIDNTQALQQGQLTGNYVPPGALNLIQTILKAKNESENTLDPTTQSKDSAAANAARMQLASMGINPALYGADVSYADAMKNSMNTGNYVMPTLAGVKQSTDLTGYLPNGQMSFPAQIQQAALTGTYQGQQTLPAMVEVSKINDQLANTAIAQGRLAMDQNNSSVDNSYKQWLQQKGISAEKGTQATNGYITQIMSASSREAAIAYITQHAQDIIKDGADVNALMGEIDKVWGGVRQAPNPASNTVTGTPNSYFPTNGGLQLPK